MKTPTKASGQFQDLETRLNDLLQNIDMIKKDRKTNLVSIAERNERHLTEIQHIRTLINEHVDTLENEIIRDLEKKEYQCQENIQKVLSSVKEKKI